MVVFGDANQPIIKHIVCRDQVSVNMGDHYNHKMHIPGTKRARLFDQQSDMCQDHYCWNSNYVMMIVTHVPITCVRHDMIITLHYALQH